MRQFNSRLFSLEYFTSREFEMWLSLFSSENLMYFQSGRITVRVILPYDESRGKSYFGMRVTSPVIGHSDSTQPLGI